MPGGTVIPTPPLPSANCYAVAAEAAAAATMRLITAHICVLGEGFVPVVHCPRCGGGLRRGHGCRRRGWGYHRRACAERFFAMYIHACRNMTPAEGGHRQGDGGVTERAVGAP